MQGQDIEEMNLNDDCGGELGSSHVTYLFCLSALGISCSRVPSEEAYWEGSLFHDRKQDSPGTRVWHDLPWKRWVARRKDSSLSSLRLKLLPSVFVWWKASVSASGGSSGTVGYWCTWKCEFVAHRCRGVPWYSSLICSCLLSWLGVDVCCTASMSNSRPTCVPQPIFLRPS